MLISFLAASLAVAIGFSVAAIPQRRAIQVRAAALRRHRS
jgi:hypothetical protein